MTEDFKIRGFAGRKHLRAPYGELLMETIHHGIGSAQIEIEVWQDRMRCGDASRAELIDLRPGGTLTDLDVREDTEIDWMRRIPVR